ncbi:hypothetical protein [Streptacidiphilus sp. EB103A]|uniref:hypothetical protein n=1 Tax=Streptacidiphilus sp. EB103A TaxID=3156275 RepID=UPI0035111B07
MTVTLCPTERRGFGDAVGLLLLADADDGDVGGELLAGAAAEGVPALVVGVPMEFFVVELHAVTRRGTISRLPITVRRIRHRLPRSAPEPERTASPR